MPQPPEYAIQTLGSLRRSRAALLRSTALQAAVLAVVALPIGARAEPPAPNAQPGGGTVIAGQARIRQSATTTTIDQSSASAALNWQSFNVGSQQRVQFNQPSSSALTLNRVVSPDASQIAGRITANGRIVLMNQSGVVFLPGSSVDAQSVVVSAASMSDGAMRSAVGGGRLAFDLAAKPGAVVSNAGRITVAETGLAALVAPQVANSGVISARLGHVVLAGAETATLDLYGDGLLSIDVTKQVTQGALGARPASSLVSNTGTITASGGTVLLTAAAADGVVQTLVTAGGRISANSVGSHAGTVVISGTGGSVVVEGALQAEGHAPGTQGGRIAVVASGDVTLTHSARVNASGAAGGGLIAIGTTLARAAGGASVIPTMVAKHTTIEAGAVVRADATGTGAGAGQTGAGGRITVLSSATTDMAGGITARGAGGGNGGFVELSGGTLALGGTVDVGSTGGHTGSILIDPLDLVISATQPAGYTPFTPSGGIPVDGPPDATTETWITPASVAGLTGSIVMQARQDITIDGAISITDPATSLEFDAGRTITVTTAGSVSIKGALVLNAADSAITGSDAAGSISIKGSLATTDTTTGIKLIAGTDGIAITGSLKAPVIDVSATGGGVAETGSGVLRGDGMLISSFGVTGAVKLGNSANAIASLGGFTVTGGGFSLKDGASLTVIGAVASGSTAAPGSIVLNAPNLTLGTATHAGSLSAATVTLQSTGAISESAASSIIATTLVGPTGATSVALDSAGNQIGSLDGATATGSVAVQNAGDLTVAGAVSGSAVSISANAGSTAASGTLTVSADVTATGSGAVTLNAAADLTQTAGTITGGTVSLLAPGAIGQSGGGITAATLLGPSGAAKARSATLSGSNAISTLGAFATSGDLTLIDTKPLSITGAVSAADAAITDPALTVSAAITAAGMLALTTDDLTLGAGATLTANTVALAPHSALDIHLIAAGNPGNASGLKLTQADIDTITAGTLQLGKDTASGKITAANIAIDAPIHFAGTLLLDTNGTISQSGALSVGTLGGSAGSASLLAGGNVIGTLDAFTTTGAFSLFDGTSLAVSGAVSAASLSLSTGNALTIGADLTATGGGTVTLSASGGLAQNAGSIISGGTVDLAVKGAITQDSAASILAATLAGTSTATSVALAGTDNQIGTLAGFAATGAFSITDNRSLSLSGTLTAGTVGITTTSGHGSSGDLAIGGSITAISSGTLNLNVAGAVSESGGITAGTLQGQAGSASLTSSGNLITTLGGFTATGAFSLIDGRALTVAGPVSSGDAYLSSSAITVSGSITATFTLGLATNALTLTGTLQGGTVAIAPQSSEAVFLAASHFTFPGLLVLTESDLDKITAGTILLGQDTATGTITATSIAILAPISVPGTLVLDTTGQITQSAGLTAGTLGGSAASLALTRPDNHIAALGSFVTTGTLTLNTDRSLAVSGPVSASTISLATAAGDGTAGDLTLDGNLTTAGTVGLSIAGAITQDAGSVISAGTLAGSAASAAFDGANQIGTLANFTTAVGLSLTNAQSLQLTGALSASDVAITVTTGDLTQTNAASIAADTLSGSAAGTATFGGSDNRIATLAGFTTGADLTLDDNRNLSLAGTIGVSGGTVSLAVNGGITQAPDSIIKAAALTGSAGTASFDGTNNQIAALAGFTTTGGFALTDAGDLTLSGGVSANAVTLTVAGAITQAAAAPIITTSLTGSATSAAFTATDNQIASLVGFTTTAGLTLADNRNLSIAGAVSASDVAISISAGHGTTGALALASDVTATGTLSLTVAGAITQSAGQISAGTLQGRAASAVLTQPANQIAALGGFTTRGTLSLADNQSLTLSGPVAASGITLTVAGAITQGTGSAIVAGALSGSATSATFDDADNQIATLLGFTASGGFTLADNQSLTVSGAVSGSALTITTASGHGTTGDLVLDAGLTATADGTVTLTAAGAITQDAGSIAAGTLTGGAASATFKDTGNLVGTLGDFTATGFLSLHDAQDLALLGTVRTSAVSLTVAGAITQASGASVIAGSLAGSATSAAFTGGDNQIATLAGFTTTSGFTLDDNRSLTVGGAVSASAVTLAALAGHGTTGDLTLAAGITASGAVGLTAAGAITQSNSAGITAASLSGAAASAAFDGTDNQIATLSGFTTGGLLRLADNQSLTVSGAVSAGAVTLTIAGDLALNAAIDAGSGGTVNLGVTGAITQSAATTISAGTLTGSAASGAFSGTGNQIATLAGFTTTGALSLVDSQSLGLTGGIAAGSLGLSVTGDLNQASGTVTAGTVSLAVSGAITQSTGASLIATTLRGTTTAGSADFAGQANKIANLAGFTTSGGFALTDDRGLALSGTLSASGVNFNVAGAITQASSGGIIAGTLTGSAASTAFTGSNNQIATLAGFTTAGQFTLADSQSLSVTGPISANSIAITTTSGGLALGADVTASGGVIALTVAGDLAQNAGVMTGGTVTLDVAGAITQASTAGITATTLLGTGTAASAAFDGQNNQITTLAGFTTTGALALTDSVGLTVSGGVSASTVTLTTDGGLALNADLTGGAVSLIATGAITQSAGSVLTAASLTGSAASAQFAGTGNRIATLAGFTSAGTLSVVDQRDLALTGDIAASAVALEVSGAVTQASTSRLITGALSGSATSAAFAGQDNQIATLAGVSTTGALSLADNQSLTVTGPVAASAVTITASAGHGTSGDLTLEAGITAPGGAITLTASGALAQTAGTIDGATVTLTAGNAISQTGGGITAGTLTGQGASATLSSTGNLVGDLGDFTTAGDFSLTDAASLTVLGTVTAGSAATLALNVLNGNDLTIGPSVTAANAATAVRGVLSGGTVMLDATGAITEAFGTIKAVTLIGPDTTAPAASVSLGYIDPGTTLIDDSGLNFVGTLGRFAASGAFTMSNTESLTVGGPVTGGTILIGITSGDLTIAGNVTGGSDVTLLAPFADGNMTQTGGLISAETVTLLAAGTTKQTGGSITATLLRGASETLSPAITFPPEVGGTICSCTIGITSPGLHPPPAAAVFLDSATNQIATLGDFATSGDFRLTDAQALTVVGQVGSGVYSNVPSTTGNVTLTVLNNGALTIGTTGSAGYLNGATVSLQTGGDITEPNGAIVATTLIGPGTAAPAASVALTSTGNLIGQLGIITANGAISITDAQSLTVSGDVTANSGSPLTLTVAGSVTQSAGSITAGTLSGAITGALTLADGGNAIATIGNLTVGGAARIRDASSVGITGALAVGSLTLTDNNAAGITIAGSIASPGAVTLNTTVPGASVTETGGTMSAGTLSGTIGGDLTLASGGNAITAIDALTVAGNATITNATGLTVLDPLTAANITLTDTSAQGITLAGTGGASIVSPGTVTLIAANGGTGYAITEAGGTIQAGTLAGLADSATLTGNNLVHVLGDFTAPGGGAMTSFRFTDATPLALLGTLDAGTVRLDVAGAITQPSGQIVAATLAGTATGAAFGQANQIATLLDFATSGDFALTDAQTLTVAGPWQGAALSLNVAGDLTLTGAITGTSLDILATGAITQPGGALNLAILSGQAASARFTAANQVGTLGAFTVTGDLELDDSGSLLIAGPIDAARLTLVAGGSITRTGGAFVVGTLGGRSGGAADFGADVQLGTLASFNVGSGAFALDDAQALDLTGTLSADTIAISAYGRIGWSGTIETTGLPRLQQIGAGVTPPGSYLVVNGGAPSFEQTGTAFLTGRNGGTPTLRIQLGGGGGTISFAGLDAGTANLILGLNSGGNASGVINVGQLTVIGTGGTTQLTGTIQGVGGQAAAGFAVLDPQPSSSYRFNACPLHSVNCVLLPAGTLPAGNPLQNLAIQTGTPLLEDPDLQLPNVSDQDY